MSASCRRRCEALRRGELARLTLIVNDVRVPLARASRLRFWRRRRAAWRPSHESAHRAPQLRRAAAGSRLPPVHPVLCARVRRARRALGAGAGHLARAAAAGRHARGGPGGRRAAARAPRTGACWSSATSTPTARPAARSWCARCAACGFAAVDFLVPNRFRFGYGLTPEIVALRGAARADTDRDGGQRHLQPRRGGGGARARHRRADHRSSSAGRAAAATPT